MKNIKNDREKLLNALIEYADKSGNFNPQFYKKEMIDSLGVTEKEFNIMQKKLGPKYCYYAALRSDGELYAINLSECLELKEQYDKERIDGKRHKELKRLAVWVAILGAVLGVCLNQYIL